MTASPELDLRGTWFVLPTPFDEQGALDLESQRHLVEASISWGADGLTAMGVTSEATELAPEERAAALAAVAAANGGAVPLVVGCSGRDAAVVTDLIGKAREADAAAAMVHAPPGAPDVEAFFGAVSEAGLPVVVQDEPAASGVTLPVATLLRCLEAAGSRTVKLEDPPTPPKIARLLEADPSLRVFGGLGGVTALSELRRGACGTMTGFAFPEILRAVRELVEAGDPSRAARVFDRYLPLIQFEAQPGVSLAVRKEILRRRGAMATAATRRGGTLDVVTGEELDEVLIRVGIEPARTRLAVS